MRQAYRAPACGAFQIIRLMSDVNSLVTSRPEQIYAADMMRKVNKERRLLHRPARLHGAWLLRGIVNEAAQLLISALAILIRGPLFCI